MIKYYYIDDISKQQQGPFSLKELLTKKIRPETKVWRSGLADWDEAGNVEELAFLFDSSLSIPQEKTETIRINVSEESNHRPQAPVPTMSRPQPTAIRPQQSIDDDNKWNDILPMPKNWLLESILLSIFCCSPISVVGIFYASKVESLYHQKDYKGAVHASERAKVWALAGILFLPACYVLFYVFIVLLYFIAG
ncbi:hypothetical protein M2451_001199 [Dysgonomonas sp. PFB1-18]|uniref:CD225/dispanin family protein n=1 Tax=unclassified Dysgonomonas TaxID=2630389 RepID=UPI002476BF73|nr:MULTISPECIES: CD225/dispanin family protein [unclassified Dysgonomonas]MDH6308176.1 hypothetical protein [Dysgonomonas sp. PF1-14]MDH6338385.1 hypothetical protein [Dysgonomonas sp. PF1-16]MDH6379882.1 hypothetical protein [Dysgonomonas sp. PFB1-18]MDH6397028.1 hypothetical protein [Dysgonomonas sp. PF1-23]